jgi:hypothetical protein
MRSSTSSACPSKPSCPHTRQRPSECAVEFTLANELPRLDLSLTVILFPTEAVHNLGQSATKQSVSVPNRRAVTARLGVLLKAARGFAYVPSYLRRQPSIRLLLLLSASPLR